MKPTNRLVIPILALCLTAASGHAATIAYNFGSSTQVSATIATSAASSNDFGSGITASVWTLTGAAAETTVAINQSNHSATSIAIGSVARARKKATNAVHTFSVTIPSGVTVDLTELKFRFGSYGADTSVANPNKFTFTVGNGGSGTPSSGSQGAVVGTNGHLFTDYTISLAGLLGETATTINFTITDTSGGNNNTFDAHFTYVDNVILTGTVVPEPRAALLGSLGMLMLLRRRR